MWFLRHVTILLLISSLLGSDLVAVLHVGTCCRSAVSADGCCEATEVGSVSGCCSAGFNVRCSERELRHEPAVFVVENCCSEAEWREGDPGHDKEGCAICRAIRTMDAGGCDLADRVVCDEIGSERIHHSPPLSIESVLWGTGATRGPPLV